MKEHGSKISEAEKKAIDTASANLRNVLKGTDIEEIKKKTQELVQASMKLGEAVYKNQQNTSSQNTKKTYTQAAYYLSYQSCFLSCFLHLMQH